MLTYAQQDVTWAATLLYIKNLRLNDLIKMNEKTPDFVPEYRIEMAIHVEKLLSDVPDLLTRHLFWGRDWAMIEFLLAPTYGKNRNYSDSIIMALYGRDILNPKYDRLDIRHHTRFLVLSNICPM